MRTTNSCLGLVAIVCAAPACTMAKVGIDASTVEAGFEHIKGMVDAQHDLGLAHLKQLENLQSLDLNGTQITDAGLAELKTLKNLQTLVIGYNETMNGTGLAELKDLRNLQHLDLIHSSITDEGAKSLAVLRSLKTIDLRGTQITDAGSRSCRAFTA